MFKYKIILTLLSVLLLITKAESMPKGAYLTSPVYSTNQLVNEIKQNTEVRKRYKLFYNLKDSEVLPFFSKFELNKNLVSKYSKIYYWRNLNSIKLKTNYRLENVNKNFYIFSDKYNHYLLRKCGNPVTYLSKPIVSRGKLEIPKKDYGKVASNEREMPIETRAQIPFLDKTSSAMDITLIKPNSFLQMPIPHVESVQSNLIGSGQSGIGLPLGAIAVSTFFLNTHTGIHPNHVPINSPEPISIILMLGGLGAIGILKRKK